MTHDRLALLLPVRPPPIGLITGDHYDTESLGSWLHRLARANGYKNQERLLSAIGISSRFPLGTGVPRAEPAFEALRQASGLDVPDLKSMLPEYALRFSVIDAPPDWEPVEIASHTAHVDSRRQDICFDCLAEDAVAYWRRDWLLTTTTVCPRHHHLLHSACPQCRKHYLSRGIVRHQLRTCCDHTFSIERLALLFGVGGQFECPWKKLMSARPAHINAGEWCDGVLHILLRLGNSKWIERLSNAVPEESMREVLSHIRGGISPFGRFSAIDRYRFIVFLCWLLGEWPHRFFNTIKRTKARTDLLYALYNKSPAVWLQEECLRRYGFPDARLIASRRSEQDKRREAVVATASTRSSVMLPSQPPSIGDCA